MIGVHYTHAPLIPLVSSSPAKLFLFWLVPIINKFRTRTVYLYRKYIFFFPNTPVSKGKQRQMRCSKAKRTPEWYCTMFSLSFLFCYTPALSLRLGSVSFILYLL